MTTENLISPPTPLPRLDIADSEPEITGFPFSIGLLDLRRYPDALQVEGKPWIALVQELPARTNRWRKYHATPEDAVNDAVACGLLPEDIAAIMRQNYRCVDGQMIVWCGMTQHAEASLASFAYWHVATAPASDWHSLKSALWDPVLSLAPTTEAMQ